MKLHFQPKQHQDYLKIRLVLACWFIMNLILRVLKFIQFKKVTNPKKILVFRTGSIGDSICAMPAISNIGMHYPSAIIHLLTNAGKGHRNLVSMEAMISPEIFDEIINYENLGRKELSRKLWSDHYDLVIQLPQYGSSMTRLLRDMIYFRWIVGIPSGFGWQCDHVPFFKKAQEKYLCDPDERTRLNEILNKNGVKLQLEDHFPFQTTSEDHLKISNLIDKFNLSAQPLIAVVPGAKRLQNRWPLTYFALVIQHFCTRYKILLLGGPDDESLVTPILTLPNTISLCGQITPIQSGLLMQRCQLVLSNDTGPMHLAYAFGAPVIALFSNRDFPYHWFPPDNGRNTVFRATDVACSICLSETCMDNICMKKIMPADVISKMEYMIEVLTTN